MTHIPTTTALLVAICALVAVPSCHARLWTSSTEIPDHGSDAEYFTASTMITCAFTYGSLMNDAGGSLCEQSHTETNHFGTGITDVIAHGNIAGTVTREVLMTFNMDHARPSDLFEPSLEPPQLHASYLVVGTTRMFLNIANDTMGVFVKRAVVSHVFDAAGVYYPTDGTADENWANFNLHGYTVLDEAVANVRDVGLHRTTTEPLAKIHFLGDYAVAVAPQYPNKWVATLRTVIDLDSDALEPYLMDPGRSGITLSIECFSSVSDKNVAHDCWERVHDYSSAERRVHFDPTAFRLVTVWKHTPRCPGTRTTVNHKHALNDKHHIVALSLAVVVMVAIVVRVCICCHQSDIHRAHAMRARRPSHKAFADMDT